MITRLLSSAPAMLRGLRLARTCVTELGRHRTNSNGSSYDSQGHERNNQAQTGGTFNADEVHKFGSVKDWWDPFGSQRGLHAYNPLRVDFVRKTVHSQGEANKGFYFLKDKKVLDVGSGPGIFAESIARFGAKVTGLDANSFCTQTAKDHKANDLDIKDNIEYVNNTLEQFNRDGGAGKFDVVTAFEVIEHVNDIGLFLREAAESLKDDGLLFISTMEKSTTAYFMTIVMAEHVMRIVEPGTHDYEKYICFRDLAAAAELAGLESLGRQYTFYNPLNNEFFYTNLVETNYIAAFRKKSSNNLTNNIN